jgi:hypothetical protein
MKLSLFSDVTESARYRDFPVRCACTLLLDTTRVRLSYSERRMSSRSPENLTGNRDRKSGILGTPHQITRIAFRLLVRASGLRLFEPPPQIAGEFGHQLQFAGEFGRQLRFRQRQLRLQQQPGNGRFQLVFQAERGGA